MSNIKKVNKRADNKWGDFYKKDNFGQDLFLVDAQGLEPWTH